jgi:hypothetical protein
LGKPVEKGDINGAIAAATKDKYLTAPEVMPPRSESLIFFLLIRRTLHTQIWKFR